MADAPATLDEMHKQIADIQDKIRRLRRERMDTENTTPNPRTAPRGHPPSAPGPGRRGQSESRGLALTGG